MVVIGLHADGGHGQVRAVDGNHASLRESGLWVVFLNSGVDRDSGNDEEDDQVDLDRRIRRVTAWERRRVLTEIAAWFIEQPPLAKKIYMMMVIAKAMVYMLSVEPIRIALQPLESYVSIFSKQYSA